MAKWSITGESEESYRQGHLIGTPRQVAERIATYVERGARSFVMWFPDYPSLDSLELFAAEVMPVVRDLA
jgi:alkanesulfonate monooxygenase SsuD/methylene tetrahydromethanopterin reductase-like flavin-dependent oxidoreductase (luciferase family)